tara:strand:- start:414 stop:1028 length:615 start_codon:yes stop_codon:yes gene_type:complete
MNKIIIGILVGSLAILVSCNVYKEVEITKRRDVDFEIFESYAWLPDLKITDETDYNNDFVQTKTKNHFAHCMIERKLKVDTIKPDLLLRVKWLSHPKEVSVPLSSNIPNTNDIRFNNDPTSFAAPTYSLFGGGNKASYIPGSKYSNEKIEYAHGGVKLTIIDRKLNVVIWQGIAQGDLYDQKIMYEDLHPAIHKMMKKFPIKIK